MRLQRIERGIEEVLHGTGHVAEVLRRGEQHAMRRTHIGGRRLQGWHATRRHAVFAQLRAHLLHALERGCHQLRHAPARMSRVDNQQRLHASTWRSRMDMGARRPSDTRTSDKPRLCRARRPAANGTGSFQTLSGLKWLTQ